MDTGNKEQIIIRYLQTNYPLAVLLLPDAQFTLYSVFVFKSCELSNFFQFKNHYEQETILI